MRNNKNKGFTLVELLVVIAILAILATVSVVGYTSFIESATVSNDENIAAQLNNFLVAMKADSNGPFYGEEINEDNIWEVTQYILKDSGLEELEPQAAKYEYHFYFDLAKGEYVVLHNDDAVNDESVLDKLIRFALTAFAEGEEAEPAPTYKVTAGNCFTKEYKYFLVDTKGDLADVITGYYSFENLEGETTEEKFADYISKVGTANITSLTNLVNSTVFVTENGNYVANLSDTHNKLVFHEGATYLSNVISDGTNDLTLGGDNYLLSFDENGYVEIPAGIMLPTNCLHISVADGKKVVLELNGASWRELEKLADRSFTNTNVTVVLNNAEYIVEDALVNTMANKGNTVVEDAAARLVSNFPLYDFDIIVGEVKDKVINTLNADGDIANTGYVALDINGGFQFTFANVNKIKNEPASIPDVTFIIESLIVAGYELNPTVADDLALINKLVTIDTATGEVTFNKGTLTINDNDTKDDKTDDTLAYVVGDGVLPPVDKIVVTATANKPYTDESGAEQYASSRYELEVVRIKAVELLMQNASTVVNLKTQAATFVSGANGLTQLVLVPTITYSHAKADGSLMDGIVLDDAVVLEYMCEHEHGDDCCPHVHDETCDGVKCTHTHDENCKKDCTHKHTDNGGACCNHQHTENCFRGKCSHISGGDHGVSGTKVVNGVNVTNRDGCAWACTHECNDDDGCFENCEHKTAAGSKHFVYVGDDAEGCLTCSHLAEDATHDGNCCTAHYDTLVKTDYGFTSYRYYKCSNCKESHEYCVKVKIVPLGTDTIVEAYCSNACNTTVDADFSPVSHSHSKNCCSHVAGNHVEACFTCDHLSTHNDQNNDPYCHRSCGHDNHTDECYNCTASDGTVIHAHDMNVSGSTCVNKCEHYHTALHCEACTHKCTNNNGACLQCLHACLPSDECMDCNHTHTEACETGCTYSEAKKEGFTLTASNPQKGTMTITVGGYDYLETELEVLKEFEITANKDIVVVGRNGVTINLHGTDNYIYVSDLFTGTIPAGAQLVIFSDTPDSNFMKYPQNVLSTDTDDEFYVNVNEFVIDKNNPQKIQFIAPESEEASQDYYIAIFKDGYRLSDSVKVKVVVGKNVRHFDDLSVATKTEAKNNSATAGGSNVLLGDIYIPNRTDATKYAIFNNGTLYGNHFTFDITHGAHQGKSDGFNGVITLNNSDMQDLRVIGALYPTATVPSGDPYGMNAVLAKGTVNITNCYISNCRAPLASGYEDDTMADNVTVTNSVLFGGAYCTIELRAGYLEFKGKVITINQPHTDERDVANVNINDKMAGLGIAVWFQAPAETGIKGLENTVQYNFIPNTYRNLPVIRISFSDINVEVPTSTMIDKIFSETKYSSYIFDDEGTKYVNASVVGEDMGMAVSALTTLIPQLPKIESGDRTGLGSKGFGIYDYTFYEQKVKISFLEPDVNLHIYGIVCNDTTKNGLFEDAKGAEYTYSPWEHVVNGETVGAYDFGATGSILPSAQ